VREVERRGLIVVFIMMIVVSDGNRAIGFSKLRDCRVRSHGDWLLKNVSDREGGAGVWRREGRIFNSSFFVESLHIQR
jgi:hypothetical protein